MLPPCNRHSTSHEDIEKSKNNSSFKKVEKNEQSENLDLDEDMDQGVDESDFEEDED